MAFPTVNIPIGGLTAMARKAAVPILHLMGKKLVRDLKERLSVKGYGFPSPPGMPPYMQTGELRDSVSYVVHPAITEVSVIIGHPAAFYLEFGTRIMSARPIVRGSTAKFAANLTGETVQFYFGARHTPSFDIQ